MPKGNRLPRHFYTGDDVTGIARALLGKILCTHIEGILTTGIIVETEAYRGPEDRGSHAYKMRRTPRNEPMYLEGGNAYIYICYGIHHLFNVVTAIDGNPHAVLIRGLEPLEGIDAMLSRRKMICPQPKLTAGPGSLAMALGLDTSLTGQDMLLRDSPVWIEDRGHTIARPDIVTGPRVGMNFPGEWAVIPWRFSVRDNPWVSPAK